MQRVYLERTEGPYGAADMTYTQAVEERTREAVDRAVGRAKEETGRAVRILSVSTMMNGVDAYVVVLVDLFDDGFSQVMPGS